MKPIARGFGLATALLAAPAAAQDTPPDLSGFWGPVFDLGEPAPDMLANLPEGTVLVEDTGVVEFPRGEYGGLELTEEAQARARDWQPEDEMTLSRVCLPPSIVYALQGPFPFEIHQTGELIVIRYEYFDQVRLVFMDGRKAPADYPLSKMGFSTGRWEGEDLVIETTHIAPSTITNNGLDHSDELRMVERYRMAEDGERLAATQWFSDPVMLENNGVRWIEWEKREGSHVYPYECDPSFALEYGAGAGE
ncbi:hypothetical protein [Aurantiacibacter poecillastricola]|uniref:hypothetical protein n=1 Tax=Aurantiacibacter poecillastricola TaxID=3064385 RepID=UPI00273E2180|nr:hypothetical protein [Aurantiacibacter sp. 219JJ12-13]MDP5261227.1 hypothetical protein [Aurantiacibacter sp. 219JJ12-13]